MNQPLNQSVQNPQELSPSETAASQPAKDQMRGIQCEKAKDIPEKKDKKAKRPKTPVDPRWSQFIAAFSRGWKERYGSKYMWRGAADGVALKRLLTANPDLTVEAIMGTIRFAWNGKDHVLRGMASSIAGAASQWNRLVANKRPENPRPATVASGPQDPCVEYGTW